VSDKILVSKKVYDLIHDAEEKPTTLLYRKYKERGVENCAVCYCAIGVLLNSIVKTRKNWEWTEDKSGFSFLAESSNIPGTVRKLDENITPRFIEKEFNIDPITAGMITYYNDKFFIKEDKTFKQFAEEHLTHEEIS
jgi:hypothetical protein